MSLFQRLEEGMHVSLLCAKLLSASAVEKKTKRARRRWGQKHRRWAHCVVLGRSGAYVTVRESSGKQFELSPLDVSNRVVLGWYRAQED